MKVLLTGFGEFGNVLNNPTERIVRHFEREKLDDIEIKTAVLPVSFARSAEMIRALLAEQPFDAAVMLGVAVGAAAIRLEHYGRNRDAARIPDCDRQQPFRGSIIENAPRAYRSSISKRPILAALRAAGIPARFSQSAGKYVCNHAYFQALHFIAEQPLPTQCLFVHVPADSETLSDTQAVPLLPLDKQIEAIKIVLKTILNSKKG